MILKELLMPLERKRILIFFDEILFLCINTFLYTEIYLLFLPMQLRGPALNGM